MKRKELSQLLCDMVLAGANGGHLSSDGVHILTQGNTMLLRLIPICIKPCGEHMNLVCQGLSRTGGDLRVVVLGSPTLGVAPAPRSPASRPRPGGTIE